MRAWIGMPRPLHGWGRVEADIWLDRPLPLTPLVGSWRQSNQGEGNERAPLGQIRGSSTGPEPTSPSQKLQAFIQFFSVENK